MSATQILIFDPNLLACRSQSALVEIAWPLPGVRIADIHHEYDDLALDADQERRRLKGVDTVILQIAESARHSLLLGSWITKVLALEAGRSGPSSAVGSIRRIGAVIVRDERLGRTEDRAPALKLFLEALRRSAESVGVEWLAPQELDPRSGPAAFQIGLTRFAQRLQGRDAWVADDGTTDLMPEAAQSPSGERVAHWSVRFATAAAIGQLALPVLRTGGVSIPSSWMDLTAAWLGVALCAALTSRLVLPVARDGIGWLIAGGVLFALQIVVRVIADPAVAWLGVILPWALVAALLASGWRSRGRSVVPRRGRGGALVLAGAHRSAR